MVGGGSQYGRKSSRLRSVPTAMAPVRTILLLGGVAEVCRHLPRPLSFGLRSPGEILDSVNQRDGDVLGVITSLEASHLETRHEVPCYFPPVLAAVQG